MVVLETCSSLLLLLSSYRSALKPLPSYVLIANPTFHAKRYHHFKDVRKSHTFRLWDTPLDSIVRMYELLLCELHEQLALEAEYFWQRNWKVSRIPDPKTCRWEQDLERDRIFQALALVLVDSFNYRVSIQDCARPMDKLPAWAIPLLDYISGPDELHQCYPGIGMLYFFLPWQRLSFCYPPCYSGIIASDTQYFINIYKHHPRLLSLPFFLQRDTMLSSICRIHALSVLAQCVPEMEESYHREIYYFFEHYDWRKLLLDGLIDPRLRWKKMEFEHPEAFAELTAMIKGLREFDIFEG